MPCDQPPMTDQALTGQTDDRQGSQAPIPSARPAGATTSPQPAARKLSNTGTYPRRMVQHTV